MGALQALPFPCGNANVVLQYKEAQILFASISKCYAVLCFSKLLLYTVSQMSGVCAGEPEGLLIFMQCVCVCVSVCVCVCVCVCVVCVCVCVCVVCLCVCVCCVCVCVSVCVCVTQVCTRPWVSSERILTVALLRNCLCVFSAHYEAQNSRIRGKEGVWMPFVDNRKPSQWLFKTLYNETYSIMAKGALVLQQNWSSFPPHGRCH